MQRSLEGANWQVWSSIKMQPWLLPYRSLKRNWTNPGRAGLKMGISSTSKAEPPCGSNKKERLLLPWGLPALQLSEVGMPGWVGSLCSYRFMAGQILWPATHVAPPFPMWVSLFLPSANHGFIWRVQRCKPWLTQFKASLATMLCKPSCILDLWCGLTSPHFHYSCPFSNATEHFVHTLNKYRHRCHWMDILFQSWKISFLFPHCSQYSFWATKQHLPKTFMSALTVVDCGVVKKEGTHKQIVLLVPQGSPVF